MTERRPWAGFRSILCPIDFSEQSALALRYADAMARRGNAKLAVVHVNDPLLIAAAAVALHDRQIGRRSARELERFVDATIPTDSGKRPQIKTRVTTGKPADEILKIAIAKSDLIVIGTHGLTGPDRLLMGSTTLSVLQKAPMPVLAVPHTEVVSHDVSPSWPGQRILAAIDLEERPVNDAVVAARIARWFDASLVLVHVVATIAAPAWLKGDLSAHDRIRIARVQERLDAVAADLREFVHTEVRVVCGNIPDELSALAAKERTALLVTFLDDRRGWFGARRGSISYHVLTNAVAPVLACPPHWRPR